MPESHMQWGDQFSDYNHVYYGAPCVPKHLKRGTRGQAEEFTKSRLKCPATITELLIH